MEMEEECVLTREDEVENDDGDLAEPNGSSAMQIDDEDIDMDMDEGKNLNVQDIDVYWLQTKIDPHLAEEVLKILSLSDCREVENKLLLRLEFHKLGLIKFLLRNRLKIVWCTRLARAHDQEERDKVEEEMKGPELQPILEQFRASGSRNRNRLVAQMGRLQLQDQRHMLDFDRLVFHEGGFFMANINFHMPRGFSRFDDSRGFDEILVPKIDGDDEKLVKISSMPDWAQPAFNGMTQLNRIQSKVYDTALFKPHNLLLCAPTGSGNIEVAVLTILQLIARYRNQETGSIDHSAYKIVYVAPMKALVTQVVGNLSNRLQVYGVKVRDLQSLTPQQTQETQILVTTPEKWDVITRKPGDRTFTQLVKLLIIDKIHLLHDNRGPVLESIVARTIRQIETTNGYIRLVGLSANLPNYEDVALFLRVDPYNGLFYFDNTDRPVPLFLQYFGISVTEPLQRLQLMNDICYEKVMDFAGMNQVLIFVHSRKETAKTARAIRDTALANDTLGRLLREDSASREILLTHTDLVNSNDLKDLLPYGFSIYHAGMTTADRQLVEELFADGHVKVLVSTATLAWGVNLSAHTVIIKGTQIYNPEKGAWTELSPVDVTQMLGHAGIPKHLTYCLGIIITGFNELEYYISIMDEQLPIESHFVPKLADQLNAEIVLGTVHNAREACNWIGYTYLYARMLRNPSLYGLAPIIPTIDITLEERRADLIHTAATILHKNKLVKYDWNKRSFQATDLGRIASYYYITHGTISTYNEHLKPTMGYIELCRLFSLSEEFKYVTVRQDEKMELAKLLKHVFIPIKESLEEPSAKINVLLQAYISQLKVEGLSLTSDMVFITQSAGRLLRALFEIVLKRGWAQSAEKALNLFKMVTKKSVQTPLRQFNGIQSCILTKLEKKDLAWERYYDLSSEEIAELIPAHKMGRTLHKLIHQFPKLNLAAHVQSITRTILRVELTLTPDFVWDDRIHGNVEPFWVIVEDNDGEYILHHEYFMLKKQDISRDHTLNFVVPISEPLPPQFLIRVVSDRWLGSHTVLPVSLEHL